MAVRRMFSIVLINSDAFIDLSNSAKVVYFYLMSKADDDGFINGITSALRVTGTSEQEVTELLERDFLKKMSAKIYLITHWPSQNKITGSRKQPTMLSDYREELEVVEGAYKYLEIEY